MSAKRQATTQLTHENWDQEDPSEHEEMGTFKTANKDVLEKRVIRTAKRRSLVSNEETKKSVFSGFSGFNKTQPSSFDFLANLTNGNKASTPSKSDTSVTSSLFSSKPPISGSPSGGLFGIQTTQTPEKSLFGTPSTQTSPFGSKNTVTSVFNTLKPDSTVTDSPFKIQPVSSSADTNSDSTKIVTSSTAAVSTPIFGITTTASKSLFSGTSNTTPFKIQPVSSTTTVPATNNTMSKVTSNTNSDAKTDDNKDKKMIYYAKLKGLNESVSDWIKTHVEETPLCILSPIFKDYERYLNEITEEYEGLDKKEGSSKKENKTTGNNVEKVTNNDPPAVFSGSSLFSASTATSSPSLFSSQTNPSCEEVNQKNPEKQNTSELTVHNSTLLGDKTKDNLFGKNSPTANLSNISTTNSSGFTFGISPAANQANDSTSTGDKPKGSLFSINSATATGTGLSFGVNTTSIQTTSPNSSGLSFAANINTSPANNSAPFSFGTGKPFSFNSNIKTPVTSEANNEEKDEENEPPKVEFTPITEENSVYDKRCKIFVKRDGNFVDRGVGTLYIKKVEGSEKHQLLVRANTALGNILLNIILASVPLERIGKNNVMLVCIPTPDEKPPPTPVLIRVKTTEEADELLETLKKYRL